MSGPVAPPPDAAAAAPSFLRPAPRDLTSSIGWAVLVGTFCACALIVVLHDPGIEALGAVVSGAATLIAIPLRAPIPSDLATPTVHQPGPPGATQEPP